jgi:hypothetical protein
MDAENVLPREKASRRVSCTIFFCSDPPGDSQKQASEKICGTSTVSKKGRARNQFRYQEGSLHSFRMLASS